MLNIFMLYNFWKKQYFLRKLQKNVLVAHLTIFQGKGTSKAKNVYNLFYHELGNGCFIIRLVFWKKQLEKTEKNPFVGAHGSFEGRGAHGEKKSI